MRRSILLAVSLLVLSSCHRGAKDSPGAGSASAAPIPQPEQPVRVAAEDEDLRVMLAELAASKACTLIRGQYRPLRDAKRPGVVTGTLWIQGCKITQHDRKVTFRLTGHGWMWADEEAKKAGGTFAVHQYVGFAVDAKIPGSLDIAYARKAHILSVWFSPSDLPEVKFTPTGEIDVDEQGAWSSVVGVLGSLFLHSPEHMAKDQAEAQGEHEFQKQFADGLSVTVDLCTGLPRFGLGRPAQGKMVAPDVGETKSVPVELEPGGMMAFGPYLAPHGMTVRARVTSGAVRFELACADEAAKLSQAYVDTGKAGLALRKLGGKVIDGDRSFKIGSARCPVVLVARAVGTIAAHFDWTRPSKEAAKAVGGPLIECDEED